MEVKPSTASSTDYEPRGRALLYGYSSEEILGRHRSLLIPPGEAAAVEARVGELARGEGIQGLEAVRWTRSGQRKDVSLTVSPVWDEAGQIVAVSTIARDVTWRKVTRATLATTAELFRVAFANAPIGMILADADLKPLQLNPALCAMLGYTEEELLTQGLWEISHQDDLPANFAAIAAALAGGEHL